MADRPTQLERLAVLEAKVDAMERTIEGMDAKLDELLALRNRGVGAFWLASALTGTGIIGALSLAWKWLTN